MTGIYRNRHSSFVLAYEVFPRPNDAGLPGSMRERVRQMAGHGLNRWV